ncbi:hypothetical protein HAX54_052195, partial [Datura stramonium]|nr:hypothetical protein [Datura stramonium]
RYGAKKNCGRESQGVPNSSEPARWLRGTEPELRDGLRATPPRQNHHSPFFLERATPELSQIFLPPSQLRLT